MAQHDNGLEAENGLLQRGQDVKEQRRAALVRLRRQGLTLRELSVALAEEGCVNPETGEPWNFATLSRDLQQLRKEWREEHAEQYELLQAGQLAELNEVKRQAWQDNDLRVVLKALNQEAELLGLNAPQKLELRSDPTVARRLARLAKHFDVDEEEVQKEVEAVLEELNREQNRVK